MGVIGIILPICFLANALMPHAVWQCASSIIQTDRLCCRLVFNSLVIRASRCLLSRGLGLSAACSAHFPGTRIATKTGYLIQIFHDVWVLFVKI